MVNKDTKLNSFYTIASGLFKYNKSLIDESGIRKLYPNWYSRFSKEEYKSAFNYLKSSYYDGYLNNIFPEIKNVNSNAEILSSTHLNHLTHNEIYNSKPFLGLKVNDDRIINCTLEFIDLYLFPNNIGIFSMKFSLSEENLTLGDASDFINKVRQFNTIIEFVNKELDIKTFISEYMLKPIYVEKNWLEYNPQLKTYNILDLRENITSQEMDNLLYDIGNVAPIGSAVGEGIFAPSESYLREQLNNNKISVFKNWSALVLFDTFTRISNNFPDKFKSWETDYFHIYIHTLHIKFYMYLTNSKISDVTIVNKETESTRDEFIEFLNDYYQAHISYKFLPDLIQDKLLLALEIDNEIETMETKINRINEHAQEKREKMMNIVLMIITFLSVFSLFNDLSQWAIGLGVRESFVFPWLNLIIIVSFSLLGIFIYLKYKKGK